MRVPAEMTLDLIRRYVHDVVLVSDDELRMALAVLLRETHNLAEGAGAAATAAAFKLGGELSGKTVVGILSGGNLDLRVAAGVSSARQQLSRQRLCQWLT